MQYMGSKNRISSQILNVMSHALENSSTYVEPFVGGANMMDKISRDRRRIGADSHPYLIAMWNALQTGWIPPSSVSKEEYYAIKSNPDTDPALTGFAGFLCSFGGKWWGGYAANAKGDNYAERAVRVLSKQINSLVGVEFLNVCYEDLLIPENSVIYCDPPYAGTTNYSGKSFDSAKFWQWVRLQKEKGHSVFVSEYRAPSDFVCLLQIQHKTILDKNSQYPRIEKLFSL